MNEPNPCGVYLEHFQVEHHRLNRALGKINRRLVEFNRGKRPQAVRMQIHDQLEDLLRDLRRHFAEEAGGGCLEEAASRCPSVGPRTKRLLNEYPQLVARLEGLVAAVKSRTEGLEAWQPQFDAFVMDLRAHECAANRVLQTALGGDAADHEVEGNEQDCTSA